MQDTVKQLKNVCLVHVYIEKTMEMQCSGMKKHVLCERHLILNTKAAQLIRNSLSYVCLHDV